MRLWGIAAVCLLWMAVGCSGAEMESNKQTNHATTKANSLELSNIALGEGIWGYNKTASGEPNDKDAVPTGNICFDRQATIDPVIPDDPASLVSSAHYVYTYDSILRELKENFAGRFDFSENIEPHINNLEQYFGSGSATVLSIATRVRTVKLTAGQGEEVDPGVTNICTSGHPDNPSSFEEFVTRCGTAYLKERTLGGHIVLTAELPPEQTNRAIKLAIDNALDVGAGPHNSIGLQTMMEKLVDRNLNVEFSISTTGIRPPEKAEEWGDATGLLNSEGKIKAKKVLNYLNWLRNNDDDNDDQDGYLVAAAQEDSLPFDHPSYGDPVEQQFRPYSQQVYTECGQSGLYSQYECFHDFDAETNWIKDDEAMLRKHAQSVGWKLDNPSRVRWANDVNATKQAYANFLDRYGHCVDDSDDDPSFETVRERAELCQATFDNGDYGDLCAACDLPADHECSMETLKRMYRNLPPSTVLPPSGEGTPPNGYPNYEPPEVTFGESDLTKGLGVTTDTHACFLSQAYGAFEGGGEMAHVYINDGSWTLEVQDNLGSYKQVHGAATCVKKDIFFDTGTNSWLPFTMNTVTVNDGGPKYVELGSDPGVPALMGITGFLGGGAERGLVEKKVGDNDRVWVNSAQYTKASGMTFGLLSPDGGKVDDWSSTHTKFSSAVTPSNGYHQRVKQLGMAADEGICFLTHLEGNWDGGGEGARVYRRDGQWVLRVKAACSNGGLDRDPALMLAAPPCGGLKHVEAGAACYGFDQKNP